jgi:ABC-type multidrug transport system fused ATPase/permease subunit
LKKDIGWFDDRDNAPGILNSVLAKDVQSLNGASMEVSAVILESNFAMIVALAIGFIFHWKISLVTLGCVPFLIIGGIISAKLQSGFTGIDENSCKKANLLAGDTILNYRTVASFGHDHLIIKEYEKMV